MRRAPAQKRKIEPDPVFRSVLVSQVINKVLLKGKKDTARDHRVRRTGDRRAAHQSGSRPSS